VLTVVLPAVPGGSPLVTGGSELGLLVAPPPAGANGIGLGLSPSPSPHARVINGTLKNETTNDRLPNIVIFLHHAPSADRRRPTDRSREICREAARSRRLFKLVLDLRSIAADMAVPCTRGCNTSSPQNGIRISYIDEPTIVEPTLDEREVTRVMRGAPQPFHEPPS
jgi:hypothetical protein